MGNKTSKIRTNLSKHKLKFGRKTVDEEDLIMKCGLEKMVKRFFKDCVIVWHDPNVDSEENKGHQAQLEKFCEVKTFTEWEKAVEFIQKAHAICQVITSGTNGELLVKEIQSSQNISSIYVFCENREFHSRWASHYSNVRCVETDIQQIFYLIEQNILKWYKEASSLRINLPSFVPILDNCDKSEMDYLQIVPNFHNRLQAKKDMINLAKAVYSDEANLSYITDFDKNYAEYNKEAILKWFTQESFLYKVTNNCLRIATPDSIQYCRLLLKDMEQAIKEQYQQKSKHFSGVLYRGAYLSEDEWASLKGNLGREIEMHGFLSVSKEKKVALKFMQMDPNQKVFVTILVPKGPNEEEQGFAEVDEFSKFPQEQEILFNVRSRFTVLEAEDTCPEDLPYRHLVLLYGAQGFRRYVTEENPLREILIPNVENISCSVCSCHRNSTKMFFKPLANGSYFCEGCLPDFFADHNGPLLCLPMMHDLRTVKVNIKGFVVNYPIELKLPMYGYACSQCEAKYREIYSKCTECEKKEVWCENCLESQVDCLQKRHGIVLESNPFSFWCERMSENELKYIEFQSQLMERSQILKQAEVCFGNNQYEKALEYYSIYLQQSGNNEKKNCSNLEIAYCNIAKIYENQGESHKALEYLSKALKIYELSNGKNSAGVSAYYGKIGLVYESLGDYKKAIEYISKALKLRKSAADGENNPDVANFYNKLAMVYYKQEEIKKSLECFEKALKIDSEVYGNNHPAVAAIENNLGNFYKDQGEFKKALGFLSKALEIKKLCYGENHPEVACSYVNIGDLYMSLGEFTKALQFNYKALEINKSFSRENNSVKTVYSGQREFNEKALGDEKSCQSEIAICYSNIAESYEQLGEYEKSLEYYEKALEIRRSFFGENHPETLEVEKQIEFMRSEENRQQQKEQNLEIRKI